jgi:hypothetical protein
VATLRLGRAAATAVAAALALAPPAAAAEPQRAAEHEVKAAFLFHFTRFVEWPRGAFATPEAPFTVCVLGDDPFGAGLDTVFRGESVAGRPVQVRRPASPAAARGCQLLFVAAGEDGGAIAEVAGVREGVVLAVGDAPGHLAHGALVAFVVREGRVRLQVSAPGLRQTRLTVSSKLLRLAELVTPPEP